MVASSSEMARPKKATSTLKTAVVRKDCRYCGLANSASKFCRPTNSLLSPKASCSWNEYHAACPAGTKKKTIVIAICGASSAYGSQAERKTTRFSTGSVPCRGLELPQDVVAALHRIVERGFGFLAAGEHRLHLLLDHLAALHEVAEAQALGVLGRRLVGELLDGRLGARIALVVAGLARHLVRGEGDRHIAGAGMELHLHFRLREVGEELGHALVVDRLLAAHHPQ